MSGASGNFLQWDNFFRVQGGVSTTDSNGASSCIESTISVSTSTFTYHGPTSQYTFPAVGGAAPSVRLVMPELTDAYPNEAAYAQCSYFQTGPPPVALTAVNEIVLPARTLPRSTTDETTTGSSTSATTTTAQPGSSEVGEIPSLTSTSRTIGATASSAQNGGTTALPPPPSDDDEDEEQGNSPNAPGSPTQGVTTNSPPVVGGSPTTTASSGGGEPPVISPPSDDDGDEDQEDSPGPPGGATTTTASSGGSPPIIAPPTDDDDNNDDDNDNEGQNASSNAPVLPVTDTSPVAGSPSNPPASSGGLPPAIALPTPTPGNDGDSPGPGGVVVGGSTTISAGGQGAAASGMTFSVLPSGGGIIGIADGETNSFPLPAPAPTSGPDFVRPVTSGAGQGGFVVAGPTITEGGEGVVVSGTSYTVLPSGAGVVAVGDSGSTTLQPSQLAGVGLAAVPGSEGEFAFADQTLGVGGSAVVVAGTTYSALAGGSGGGIAIAASRSSSTIAVSEATSIPGLGEVEVLDESAGAYVLDGSATVSAGGAPVTISGTAYSALPSGFGVVVSSEGDEFAPFIEQGVSGEGQQGESYIIGAGAGSSATTVSGVVYSALPSGSGVLVVANGSSTTIAVNPTGQPTSTNGSSDDDDEADPRETVAAYEGNASSPWKRPGSGFVGSVSGCCLVFLMVVVVGINI